MLSVPSYNKDSTTALMKSVSRIDEDITEAELTSHVNYLKRRLTFFTLENRVLEKAILRLDPTLMQGIAQAMEYALRGASGSSMIRGSFVKSISSKYGMDSLIIPSRSRLLASSTLLTKRTDSYAKISEAFLSAGPKINILERMELASQEMELLVKNLEKKRNNAEKQHALLRAQLEEIGLRESYIKKATEQFHQTVIVDGYENISQRIPAEIWIRFMNEWNKVIDTQIGKLRLRTSTLNTQYSKLKGQIKKKAELSENLRPVDFEKLKIENKECMNIIEHKIQQLEELKKLTGDANFNLSVHKKAMLEQDEYLKKVLKSIQEKKKQTLAVDKERDVIQVHADELDVKLEEVKKDRMTYEVPNIMDYVKVKSEITDLKHTIKILENRAHIQDIALTSLNKKLKSISMDAK